ncbi:hypothetical protein SAMN05444365_102650 [Micromonospora pattaloongensis]|uniref:DUF4352 domain-containing protein n=1 Tax=Micromonospora pattaloongensis TaxID=405436 RepID=A0A1H3KV24_9ACTN|nr:hypothetical protein [Micromonospora pattaloongensis]SDY56067.1 hypothetical protein SAMN05444365_102650 [Micromonospora pattaloongensis]
MFTSCQRAVIAVVVGFSSILAAPQPAHAQPQTVSLGINSSGTLSPNYRIEVRNSTAKPIDVTVRQELPRGTTVTTTSPEARPKEGEVTWQLKAPPRSNTTLTSSLTHSGGSTLFSPACAYERDGSRPYSCATAAWTPPPDITPRHAPPWWQQPRTLTIIGASALVGLTLLWGLVAVARRWRRRAAGRSRIGPTTRAPIRGLAPPPAPRRRRRPPAVVVLAFTLLLLALTGALGTRAVVAGADTIQLARQQTGWVGNQTSGPVGAALREDSFEFTVYRIGCQQVGPGTRRCIATVGVHNASGKDGHWHAGLQRAYLPTGSWVSTDEAATREANKGRDMFAEPLAAGQRLLFPLAFTVTSELLPTRIELRSGAFNAGVSVTPV